MRGKGKGLTLEDEKVPKKFGRHGGDGTSFKKS